MNITRRGAVAGLAALPAYGASAQQTFPSKALTMIIPFPAGGPADTLGRPLAKGMSERLGQAVVVDNKSGAAGVTGIDIVAKAVTDPHVLGLMSASAGAIMQSLMPKMPYNPAKDIAPITLVVRVQEVLVVSTKLGIDDFKGFIAYAKANPGKVNFGSAGLATITQLYGEIFNIEAGVKMVHVPYKGSAPATNDLLSGQIQVQFDPTTLPHIAAGRLKCFAVLGEKRWPGKPDVPTLKEQGLGKIGGDAWYGILAAKGTPQVAIDKMASAIGEAVKDPALNERLVTSGNYSSFQDTATFQATIERERVSFGEIIKKADIKI